MCGISGFFDRKKVLNEGTIHKYNSILKHRGPDANGALFMNSDYGNLGIGHVRLAIVDLSHEGNQPYTYNNLVLSYNGEIYNFQEIRDELVKHGYFFKSNSDTEVVLKAFDCWRTDCVDKFNGMFAFAIYDQSINKIFICRDRIGVKPLYYYYDQETFVFSSEMKVILQTSSLDNSLDLGAIADFFQYGYTKSPNTIVKNIKKLTPGCWLAFDISSNTINLKSYWFVGDYFSREKFKGGYRDALLQAEDLIRSSCAYRTVGDVEVGTFISGGYDSTLIAQFLNNDSKNKLRSFTVSFPDGQDESKHASKIAKILNLEHHLIECTSFKAGIIIEQLADYIDDPFDDTSLVPMIILSELASDYVKVVITGDGADENFGGYTGYRKSTDRMRLIRNLRFGKFSPEIYGFLSKITPTSYGSNYVSKLFLGISEVQKFTGSNQFVKLNEFETGLSDRLINGLLNNNKSKNFTQTLSSVIDERDILFQLDIVGSLRDKLLTKFDKSTMAHSIEGREPFLDHRIIEFSAQLPFDFKIGMDSDKKILKDIVHKYLPQQVMERPKMGFDPPIFKWLRTELKFLLDDLYNYENLKKYGFFNVDYAIKLKNRFLLGDEKMNNIVWRIFIFQIWLKKWSNN